MEGIRYLQRAVQRDPRNKEAYNYMGIALQLQGDFRGASASYARALDIDPLYAAARENLERIAQLSAFPK